MFVKVSKSTIINLDHVTAIYTRWDEDLKGLITFSGINDDVLREVRIKDKSAFDKYIEDNIKPLIDKSFVGADLIK